MPSPVITPDSIFRALADPTRRDILEALASAEAPAEQLVARYAMSQPAVSRHLRVLREAGLVTSRAEGRHRYYSIEPAGLQQVAAWIESLRRFWQGRLDALTVYLDGTGEPE